MAVAQLAPTLLGIPQAGNFDQLVRQRAKHVIRPQGVIVAAILDACRTPCVQHWIMVKARLGYNTFWKHMNELVTLGLLNTSNEGNKTLYAINEKGLSLLEELKSSGQVLEEA